MVAPGTKCPFHYPAIMSALEATIDEPTFKAAAGDRELTAK